MVTVAKRYDVSSSFLARVCERLDVPRPRRGYWQQLAVGIDVAKPDLREPEPGSELEWAPDGSAPRRNPTTPTSTSPRAPRKKCERPEKHPLLVGARAHFDHAYESRDEKYVRPYKRNLVDIFVSKDALTRALAVANELFLSLEDRGQRVVLAPSDAPYRHVSCEPREGFKGDRNAYDYNAPRAWSPGRSTLTFVGDVAIGLTLFELSEDVLVRYDSKLGDYVRVEAPKPSATTKARSVVRPGYAEWTTKRWLPTGRLALHAYAPYPNVEWEQSWSESNGRELQTFFAEIGKQLQAAAPQIVPLVHAEERRVEEAERKWRVEEEERAKRAAEERRKQEELRLREQGARKDREFAESISKWRLARDVREYLAEMQGLADGANLVIMPGGDFERQLKWVADFAERSIR